MSKDREPRSREERWRSIFQRVQNLDIDIKRLWRRLPLGNDQGTLATGLFTHINFQGISGFSEQTIGTEPTDTQSINCGCGTGWDWPDRRFEITVAGSAGLWDCLDLVGSGEVNCESMNGTFELPYVGGQTWRLLYDELDPPILNCTRWDLLCHPPSNLWRLGLSHVRVFQGTSFTVSYYMYQIDDGEGNPTNDEFPCEPGQEVVLDLRTSFNYLPFPDPPCAAYPNSILVKCIA